MPEGETKTTHRLEALIDGVFAFSMTLLVIFIETPEAHHLGSPQQLQVYLTGQYPQFISYIITFLVLANFWIIHHIISRLITKTNYVNLWLNIGFMLFIVLLPFTSAILGDYPKSWGGIFLFIGNLFLLCCFLLAIWLNAAHRRKLIDQDVDPKKVRSITFKLFVGVFFSLVSIIVSFVNLAAALYVYLLIPVVLFLYKNGGNYFKLSSPSLKCT